MHHWNLVLVKSTIYFLFLSIMYLCTYVLQSTTWSQLLFLSYVCFLHVPWVGVSLWYWSFFVRKYNARTGFHHVNIMTFVFHIIEIWCVIFHPWRGFFLLDPIIELIQININITFTTVFIMVPNIRYVGILLIYFFEFL